MADNNIEAVQEVHEEQADRPKWGPRQYHWVVFFCVLFWFVAFPILGAIDTFTELTVITDRVLGLLAGIPGGLAALAWGYARYLDAPNRIRIEAQTPSRLECRRIMMVFVPIFIAYAWGISAFIFALQCLVNGEMP